MVTILEFHRPENNGNRQDIAHAPAKLSEGRSAEIIIFPGVRIEHHKEGEPASEPVKTRKRAKRTVRRKR